MGMIFDLIARRPDYEPKMNGNEKALLYSDASAAALMELPENDREIIGGLIENLTGAAVNGKKIRNFGVTSAREILMMIGILFAVMSDEDFEKMLRRRGTND